MNLLRKIVGIVLVLLLPLGVRGQSASVAEKEMTVAERNAAQGFNDTIDRSDAEQRLWEMMDNHMLTEQDMQMNLFKFGCVNTLLRYVERALAPTQIKYNWPDKFLTKSAMQITEGHFAEYYPWTMLGIRLIVRVYSPVLWHTGVDRLRRLRHRGVCA